MWVGSSKQLSRGFEFLESVGRTMLSNPEGKYYLHLKICDNGKKKDLSGKWEDWINVLS